MTTDETTSTIRRAALDDVPLLARLNQQLIRDEGHRNPMTLHELERRMQGWLAADYAAIVMERNGDILGYALYRSEPEYVYLRQLYVVPDARRIGLGRHLVQWVTEHACPACHRLRIDVLLANQPAIEFWRAIGFHDYCLTMEREASDF